MKPTSLNRITLNLKTVQDASSPPVYKRGLQYYRRKKVLKYQENPDGSSVEALVIGSEPQPYKIIVTVSGPDAFKAECSCPYFEEVCKHSVAVLLTHLARSFPGIRFDLAESDRRDTHHEQMVRARDVLEDIKNIQALEAIKSEPSDLALGALILEKPLALIIGTLPQEKQGKVNILKIPPPILDTLPHDSRIQKLVKYLTSLPQATKGMAGGHRIPRNDEGIVLGHISLCARLVNASDGTEFIFSRAAVKPKIFLSETENGELLIKLQATNDTGELIPEPVFFLGSPSWVMSKSTFYPIDLSPIHRLFQFFDAYGSMTVRLETVPKFLAVDLPILKKRMDVELDETNAPFPIAVTEPPKVVIRLNEKTSSKSGGALPPELDLSLGFAYGNLVLPSRDETSAVEAELYTRTISDSGQSVWVKRLWEQEGQLRRFLTNLQPTRMIGDRFFFHEEPALEALYYLSSQHGSEWDISGYDQLKTYRVASDPIVLRAYLSLKKDTYKFDFDLKAFSGDEKYVIPFQQIVEAVFRNKNYLKIETGEYVRLPVAMLLSVLKSIGANKDTTRPLYQALPIAHTLESHGIEIEADKGFKEFIQKLRNFQELEPINIPETFSGTLRTYQKEGFSWLGFLREYGLAGILADDMGLGKTIQALALLLYHHKNGKQRHPSLVVAPTSVVYNWMSEAEKFTPKLKTALFLGRDRAELLAKLKKSGAGKPDVIFTTYGIIRRDYETLNQLQFDYLVLDEAQNIKNPESVGAIASKSLKALHRLALSGTPVENRLKELWSIFDFLMPDFLGNYREFNETFERPIELGIGESGHKLRKIVHPFVLRRLKSQVEKELPDRTDIINLCEMEDEQRSLYLDVLDECKQQVFGDIKRKGIGGSQFSVLAALLRLRQVCCDPRLLKDRKDKALPPSSKLSALIEMIGEIVDAGHKILVFSQFVEMLSLIRTELEKEKYVYEYLDGQTPAKERLEKVNNFNVDDSIPIFLISLKAGGTGLNLTGADYVIHYDPWWNPAVENQATDRAHRIGQTRHVFNYKLITRGTVEEKILSLQKKKKELAELVIGGDESVAKELTKEDLEFLFSV